MKTEPEVGNRKGAKMKVEADESLKIKGRETTKCHVDDDLLKTNNLTFGPMSC
jgi:hypothetical protein